MRLVFVVLCTGLLMPDAFSQTTDSTRALPQDNAILKSVTAISSGSLNHLRVTYRNLTVLLQRQSEKLLASMERKESRLKQRIQGMDSVKTADLFGEAEAQYQALQNKLQAPVSSSILHPLK
ncbi:MAG: hypothetical protein KGM98_02365, partial [Bacteroidota bacterium]|nr:hypothetical protein [Bacteroidota bacterium]